MIAGPTPTEVLDRYTRLTGRPARVPEWSYGLWLSTCFTTDYDEATVNAFIDGMAERDIPLEVFHFDCFWMREFHWTDFEWDPAVFPDPEGMLARLHERGLRVSAWMNPTSPSGRGSSGRARARLPGETARRRRLAVGPVAGGHGARRLHQPGCRPLVPGAPARPARAGRRRHQDRLRRAIPHDVVWHDGSDPEAMHHRYTQLYNRAVFDVLEEVRGPGEAVLFARSATAGGQSMPVHWGGDNSSTFTSMAESLRGGLSLALSGFGYWSHDIGGFEGDPDPAVFKRWLAFGLLSSHSRLHGSTSYRVPWAFDDGDEEPGQSAVEVARAFAKLKRSLRPYLVAAGDEAHRTGRPVMRPMQLEFPDDPAVGHLDRQYLLGPSLLVAPVFSAAGEVEYYLPAGRWTNWFTREVVEGGGWRREVHGFDTRAAVGARGRGRAGRRRGRSSEFRGDPRLPPDRKFRA